MKRLIALALVVGLIVPAVASAHLDDYKASKLVVTKVRNAKRWSAPPTGTFAHCERGHRQFKCSYRFYPRKGLAICAGKAFVYPRTEHVLAFEPHDINGHDTADCYR